MTERPHQAATPSNDPFPLLLFAFPSDNEPPTGKFDLDVVLLHTGKFELHEISVVGLLQVQEWNEVASRCLHDAWPLKRLCDLLLQILQLLESIPSGALGDPWWVLRRLIEHQLLSPRRAPDRAAGGVLHRKHKHRRVPRDPRNAPSRAVDAAFLGGCAATRTRVVAASLWCDSGSMKPSRARPSLRNHFGLSAHFEWFADIGGAGIELAAGGVPADSVAGASGDWHDVIDLRDGSSVVVVGDAVGRGTAALPIRGAVQPALRRLAGAGVAPSEIISHLRDELHSPMTLW